MKSRKFAIEAVKTYATEANVEKAVSKAGFEDLRHFIMEKHGRFFPVFVGFAALDRGVHFKFNVVG